MPSTELPRETPLRVFARPAWKGSNPYTGLLADALATAGLEVFELEECWDSPDLRDGILLFHWPDEFFFLRNRLRVVRAMRLLIRLTRFKRSRRLRLVWVAHNVLPHDRRGVRGGILRRAFFRLLDGIIFLSHPSRALVLEAFPSLATKAFVIVPHGHYRSLSTRPLTLPAERGGIARLASVGRIKRYKGTEELAALISSMNGESVELVIAGLCKDRELADALAATAAGSENVQLQLKHLSQAELEAVIDAADAVVLLHRDVLNSGSALLALSRSRPVIAPRRGSLIELEAQVGSEWLWLYDGDLTTAELERAIAWLRRTPRRSHPDLSAHEWDGIGRAVAAFFRQIAV